jgi:hypothetical protein
VWIGRASGSTSETPLRDRPLTGQPQPRLREHLLGRLQLALQLLDQRPTARPAAAAEPAARVTQQPGRLADGRARLRGDLAGQPVDRRQSPAAPASAGQPPHPRRDRASAVTHSRPWGEPDPVDPAGEPRQPRDRVRAQPRVGRGADIRLDEGRVDP